MMGHESIQTTQIYTHVRPTAEVAPLEQLSGTLPIADLVTAKRRRAVGTPIGGASGKKTSSAASEPEGPPDFPQWRGGTLIGKWL